MQLRGRTKLAQVACTAEFSAEVEVGDDGRTNYTTLNGTAIIA